MQMGTLLSPPADLTPADYLTFCAAFLAAQLATNSQLDRLEQACCVGTSFDSHDIQCIYPLRLVNFSALLATPYNAGTLAGDPPPPNSAGTFDRYTELGTRAGKGNLHPPVGTRGTISGDGTWDTAVRTKIDALAASWITPFPVTGSTSTLLPVLWNKAVPARINRFLGVKPNYRIRTMRRRTVGLGI